MFAQEREAAQQLTDRVRRTVNTVKMKKEIFKRYVTDIEGVTGLGAKTVPTLT